MLLATAITGTDHLLPLHPFLHLLLLLPILGCVGSLGSSGSGDQALRADPTLRDTMSMDHQPNFFDETPLGKSPVRSAGPGMANALERAARRFPRTPNSRIHGSGEHALVFRCYMPWRVNFYRTAAERDAAWERYERNSCGAVRCNHRHDKVKV